MFKGLFVSIFILTMGLSVLANPLTVVDYKLNGNSKDSGGLGIKLRKSGKVEWADSAAKFSAEGVLIANAIGALMPGEKSVSVQFSIKPEKKQLPLATVFCVFADPYFYYVRLYHGKSIDMIVSAGGMTSLSASAKKLFDDNWHQVTAIIDRENGGQIRLYIDGKKVATGSKKVQNPISPNKGTMGLVLGTARPWYAKKGNFRYKGLIKDFKIIQGIPEAYAVAGSKSAIVAKKAVIKAPGLAGNSNSLMMLDPQKTFIVRGKNATGNQLGIAIKLMQKYLREAYGVKNGFAIKGEKSINPKDSTKNYIILGNNSWSDPERMRKLTSGGHIIRRAGGSLIIEAENGYGVLWGVVDFLDKQLGVRFYIPGELFTSKARKGKVTIRPVNKLVNPFVKVATGGSCYSLTKYASKWLLYNGLNRRMAGSHQHNFGGFLPKEKFAKKYPEIYPILKGKRYFPKNTRDQKWQPCFSEPKLIDAMLISAIKYFRLNPQYPYIGVTVQDSHCFCTCKRCEAIIAKFGGDKVKAYSDMYWKFVNKFADRLPPVLKKYGIKGNKLIIGCKYSKVRGLPSFKLRPNVGVVLVQKISDMEIDGVLKKDKNDKNMLQRWADVTDNVGCHDWAQGNGFYISRIYSDYLKIFLNAFGEKNIFFMHTENYPNWGLDAAKLYIRSRLFINSKLDPRKIWKQFCIDMFPEASKEMNEYFDIQQELFKVLNKQNERKLMRWNTQFLSTSESRKMLEKAAAVLKKAEAKAQSDLEKKRISKFVKSFKFSHALFKLTQTKKYNPKTVKEISEYAEKELFSDPYTLFRRGFSKDKGKKEFMKFVNQCLRVLTNRKKKGDDAPQFFDGTEN